MRPVAGYGVRIAAENRIRRRNLAAFCIVSFIEDSVYHRAAAAVDFFGYHTLQLDGLYWGLGVFRLSS